MLHLVVETTKEQHTTRAQLTKDDLLAAGWTEHPLYGWHRGLSAAGDRYWSLSEALEILAKETA